MLLHLKLDGATGVIIRALPRIVNRVMQIDASYTYSKVFEIVS